MKRFPIIMVCMTLLVLVVSACGSTQTGPGAPVQSTTQVAPGESTTVDPPSSAGDAPAETALPNTAIGSTSTPTVPDSKALTAVPSVKTGLEASDPKAVSLASGQVHLVEFFAFW